MPETATESPPAPLPVFTEESFAGFVKILEDLARLVEMLEPAAQIPIPASCDTAVRTVGKMFAIFDQRVAAGGVPPQTLYAWAARAITLSSMCTHVAVHALSQIGDGQEATAPVPPVAPVSTLPAHPPHLLELVRPPRGFEMPGYMHVEAVGDLIRVTCDRCELALGEVGRDIAQIVIDTHENEKHPPVRIENEQDADAHFGRGSELAAEVRERIAKTTAERVEWLHPTVPDPGPGPYDQPTCRRCYCTEGNACVRAVDSSDGSPQTCSWRELNPETNAGICTACAE